MDRIEDFDSLLRAAKQGDEQALAVLYRALQPQILRYLRGTLGQDAEDVASEVWIHVARSLASFEGDEDGLRRWVFTIAIRRRIDAQRRARKRPVPVDDARLDRPVSDRDVPLALYAAELVGRLPEDLAEILLLRVVAGFDAATVGDLVGKSPGAVRVSAHRAIERLRAIVDVVEINRAVDASSSRSRRRVVPAESRRDAGRPA